MVWLFDYDLTLYGEEERHVLVSLDHRISAYVQKTIGGTFEHASEIRTEYLHRYGTTLAGLMALHGTDPDDFFDFIHDAQYLVYPVPAPAKRDLLLSLKGPRGVFTNGRHDWSEAGMRSMGILDCMDFVFDLKALGWVGKPHDIAYEKMENFLKERLGADFNASDIVLLEDSLRNLEPAHARGWTTILVNPVAEAPDWVDFHISHLLDLDKIVDKLPC
ncbi:MAG: pyrimidine 5'-nucleotidase [Fibrobacter sp.]|uniref:pyrimidine 5'-nucleotidase n=1 Tax=Fibrobacter sp. TaxID=35828 RepID=UPI001B2874FE|nr:pyrimidine 5'-nucleotidase [Fibrobacter sp.]MBO7060917.1 pyrimidine 5'-nucleotidase [Fibrobacter sp.]MBO7105553.1 pyrimidine 5'-nucleotidase [Fibrobacter sp.]